MPSPFAPAPNTAVVPSPIELLTLRDSAAVGRRLRPGPVWEKVRPGVYAERAGWDALAPWDRYLARVHAFALISPGAVFAYESAAALHALPTFGETRDIHVLSTANRSYRFGDVCVHAGADPRVIDESCGIARTGVADTVADVARVLPPAFGLAVADAALARGIDAADLRARAAGQVNRRGRRRLDWVAERADAASESVGESISRAVIDWCGFPEPVLQQRFEFEGYRDRSDFFWPEERVVGESDGYDKYVAETPEASARRLIEEKRREDRLRRNLRGFARLDMAGAMRVEPLRRALLAEGLTPVRAPQKLMLATLRTNPRAVPRPARPHQRET